MPEGVGGRGRAAPRERPGPRSIPAQWLTQRLKHFPTFALVQSLAVHKCLDNTLYLAPACPRPARRRARPPGRGATPGPRRFPGSWPLGIRGNRCAFGGPFGVPLGRPHEHTSHVQSRPCEAVRTSTRTASVVYPRRKSSHTRAYSVGDSVIPWSDSRPSGRRFAPAASKVCRGGFRLQCLPSSSLPFFCLEPRPSENDVCWLYSSFLSVAVEAAEPPRP